MLLFISIIFGLLFHLLQNTEMADAKWVKSASIYSSPGPYGLLQKEDSSHILDQAPMIFLQKEDFKAIFFQTTLQCYKNFAKFTL